MRHFSAAFHSRRALLGQLTALCASAIGPGAWAQAAAPSDPEEAAAYRLGSEAFLYGYPLIYFAKLRWQRMMVGDPVVKEKHRWGRWVHRNVVVTPEVVGAPQTDTLYSNAWLDLDSEPYLIRVPKTDGRYWSIQLCDLLGTTYGMPNRRNSSEEQWVALVGPNWQGTLPDVVKQVHRSPMRQNFLLIRMFFDGGDADRQRAYALQQEFTLLPLSAWRAGKRWDGEVGQVFQPDDPRTDPLVDFKTLQRMWLECPPPAADAALVAPFARIGLGAGLADGFTGLSEAARRGLARAEADTRARVIAATRRTPGVLTPNRWLAPLPSLGLYNDGDHLYRAATALLGTVATPVQENIYMVLQTEPSGELLSGDARYTMRIGPGQFPRVGAFWSIHAYRETYTVIPNAINRYSISDRTQGLKRDADGGLTIYLQAEDPGGDRSANWLPTLKGKLFFLVTREYEPLTGLGADRWPGPEVRRIT